MTMGGGGRRRIVSNPRLYAAMTKVRQRLYLLTAPTPQHRRWREINGDRTLRLDYDLDPESVVFDVGGFEGQWASDLFAKYGCAVHVFEPVPAFAQQIEDRFARNPRITVHGHGLAHFDGEVAIGVSGEASSHVRTEHLKAEVETISVRTPVSVMEELGVDELALMKLNVEGAEFDLIDSMIETDAIRRVRELQIQFHSFVPDAERRLEALRSRLGQSHEMTWGFDFVWENWRRREGVTAPA